MKRISAIVACAIGVIALADPASAEILNINAAQSVVLPASEGAPTRVALLFDLSSIPGGEGRAIDAAVLDWRIPSAPEGERCSFALHAVTGGWTAVSVAGGGTVTCDEAPAAEWDIEPLDFHRLNGGFLRFDLKALVQAWTDGTRANYGVVIQTSDVGGDALSQDLSGAVLTVYYGYPR